MISNKEIVRYLTSKVSKASFIDKLKIKYRPLICPFDRLLFYSEKKSSAFDIGCGSGQFCSLIAKFTNVKKIKGVEINERLVANAKEINREFNGKKELSFSVFNGNTLPDDLKEYEIIYLIDVIHHVPRKQQFSFIKEIFEKMGEGSKLVFKDINRSSPLVFFNKFHDLVFAGEIGKEMKFKSATKMLTKIGFKILESYKKVVAVYPHYFIICQK